MDPSPNNQPPTLHPATTQEKGIFVEQLSSEPAPTQTDSTATTAHDKGYTPDDVYGDTDTFPEQKATIQIVTFSMDGYTGQDMQARWEDPLTWGDNPDTSALALRKALSKHQEDKTWRWIHCEGLHGPTMKIIAQETNWSLDKFAGIFQRTRASSEWADGCLLVHFQDQITNIWMLYKKQATNPIFITCTKSEHDPDLKKRWEDFIDFGDSRRELLLRKDPSLMLYGMTRAIIQDLRTTAFTAPKDLRTLYNIAMAHPSKRSLSHFYGLQQRLIQIKLDTTSLRDAAANLIICIENMHNEAEKEKSDKKVEEKSDNQVEKEKSESLVAKDTQAEEKKFEPLVSKDTLYRLKDQMGLIHLLFNELPEATRELDAIASLAFNILAFSNNNLLRLLAVLTIGSVPLTIACAILTIDFEGKELTAETMEKVIYSVGFAAIFGVAVLLTLGPIKLWWLRHQRTAGQKEVSLQGLPPIREAEERFTNLEAQNQRVLLQRTKRDNTRPDIQSAIVVMPVISEGGTQRALSIGAAVVPRPTNARHRPMTLSRLWQSESLPPPDNTIV